jgi:hypothetical protein
MNRIALTLCTAMLALGSPSLLAQAQTGTTTAPGAVMRGLVIADHVQMQAQVAAINYADRTVMLKGQDGKTVTLKVGPEAKNFDKVKVGDQVRADFYRSTAIALRKAGGRGARRATPRRHRQNARNLGHDRCRRRAKARGHADRAARQQRHPQGQ